MGRIRAAFEDFGGQVLFAGETLAWAVRPPFRFELLLQQAAAIGVGSTFIVAVTGLFAGMVLALQGNYAMRQFGAEGYVGGFVAISLVRELGPVFTALMVTGRSGSAITTELGTMRVTEQIDALSVMAANPVKHLIVPRVIAGVLMTPLLTVVSDFTGILGGYFVGVHILGINSGIFIKNITRLVDLNDIYNGLAKAACFGLILSLVGCYKGFNTYGGAEGVGRATTEAVVLASIAILISDYFLTAIMF